MALAAGLVACALPALAASPDRCQADRACQEQTAQAAQLAAGTKYEEALRLYQSAYDRSGEPRLLVNIGRCHYRLGRARKALELYESFRKAESAPEPELDARLGQFIAEAKLAIVSDEQSAPKPEPPEPPPAMTTPAVIPPPVAPPPVSDRGSGALGGRPAWRVGLGLGAVAVGGVLVGLGAGALAANGSCVTPSAQSPGLCAAQTRPDGQRSILLVDGITPGVPMLVTGGILLVGGVVLAALPGRKTQTAWRPRLAFAPVGLLGAR